MHASAGLIVLLMFAVAPPDLRGRWLLSSENDDAFTSLILIEGEADRPEARLLESRLPLGPRTRTVVDRVEGLLIVTVTSEVSDLSFRARLDGAEDEAIAGAVRLRLGGSPLPLLAPARLVRTELEAFGPPNEPAEPNALEALTRASRAAAIWNAPEFRAPGLRQARRLLDGLPIDARTEACAWSWDRLSEAARVAGEQAEARSAGDRARAFRAEATREQSDGRDLPADADEGPKRVPGGGPVLLELFTGSECGACVAADRAAEGLVAARGGEVILLCYHQHIPGPDPLCSPDSAQRRVELGIASAPTTRFNGRELASGGGPAGLTRGKFNQYRRIVDRLATDPPRAAITLSAERRGETIRLRAEASAAGIAEARLILALVEREVNYAGGNQVKTHPQVVRALIGGTAGHPLRDGKVLIEESIDLAALRIRLETDLNEAPGRAEARGPFPRPLPPIELDKVAIVAFVEAGRGGAVLHATTTPTLAGGSSAPPP